MSHAIFDLPYSILIKIYNKTSSYIYYPHFFYPFNLEYINLVVINVYSIFYKFIFFIYL